MSELSEQGAIDYAGLFAATPTPYLVLTPDLTIVEANHARLMATGHQRKDILGKHLFDAFPENPDDDDAHGVVTLRASLERVLETGRPETMGLQKYDIRVPGGETFVERYWSAINVPVLDSTGRVTLLLHRVKDVTEYVRDRGVARLTSGHGEHGLRAVDEAEVDFFARARELQELNRELREARDQLAARALHDPQTGLLVRSVFLEQVSHALTRMARCPHPLAVLFIDLDGLKKINDTYGHAAGDELIACSAERLRAGVRPSDPVARIGGDEFVVLLDDLHDEAEAEAVAARLVESMTLPCRLQAEVFTSPTASIGIAVADNADITAYDLVSRADAAMYRAKQSGRGRYEMFDPAAHTATSARQRLEAELRRALAAGELRLHYQPIIDLTDDTTHAVEALLRWQHPGKGLLGAAKFIDVAEESGLILDIGRWVIDRACRQLAEWDAAIGTSAPARAFVNLSAAELAQPGLAEHVAAVAAAAGVGPDRLVLEITETGILEEPQVVGEAIDILRGLGCELAIDDFGTGYSSLTRLVQLPAGILKVDRSFVTELCSGRESAAVVSAVLLLAHNLQKTVVAEGVEDASTLLALKDLGCEYAQGFHLARPHPPDVITRHLSRSR